jgi:acetyl-CoA synthetase
MIPHTTDTQLSASETPATRRATATRVITPRPARVAPNLARYDEVCAHFTWEQAQRDGVSGLPDGGVNIAHEAADRHANGPRATRVALRWRGRHGDARDVTYAQLVAESKRAAQVLTMLGIGKGSRVFTLLDRVPELYSVVIGTFRVGATLSPMFSAFGPEPLRVRLTKGDAALLVTTPAFYRRKVEAIRSQLPHRLEVLLVGDAADIATIPDVHDCRALMAAAPETFEIVRTTADDEALLHFTSGTTGTPKGAVHVHGAVLAHHVTGRYALDFHDEDVFWCTADPGWVTGTSYGIIAPLTHGITSVIDEGDFDAERWYRTLQDERVTVWYTAPTAIRMLMKAGPELARRFDLSALRLICSVGEPLNPEAVLWGAEVLGLPIHDNWWQTETGGIMIANYPSMEIRPGSMGKPMPGITAGIVRRADGAVREVTEPGEEGELALRPGWPSMFRAYLHDEDRYRKCFEDGWYLTGDLARRDADGYYWFIGRADDVIKSSGHLIGPFEVESAFLEHPAVAEAAVIGKPDAMAGALVKVFITLKPGVLPTEELNLELRGFGRRRLGAAIAPKELAFLEQIPRTRSGKIMRRLLKARELGLPEGDLSTMEGGTA